MPDEIRIPCLRASFKKTPLYVFVCDAKLLRSLVQVNRRVEDKDEGYQRAFSLSRAKSIGRYVRDGGVIPGSIIVAFDPPASYDHDRKELVLPNTPDAGWVLDGQHRLEGIAEHTDESVTIPVTAFLSIPEEIQIEQFVTINREQKGVSASLYLELLKRLPKHLNEQQATQERASDLAQTLKKDQESVFFKRIVSTTSPKPGQISTTNFVRKLVPLMKSGGVLSDYTDESRAKILSNMYRALIELKPKSEPLLFKTIGFGALMNAFPTIHSLMLASGGGRVFTISAFQRLFRTVDYYDIDQWATMGTGNNAEKLAGDDFCEELRKSNPLEVTV